MTLGPRKEHAMTLKPKQQAAPFDAERFRKELGLKLQRLVAETIEGWPACGNKRCRRAKRCVSENYECIAKWRKSLPPLSPEETAQRLADFRRDVLARKAGLPLGEQPIKPAQPNKPRGNKPAASTATRAAQRDNDWIAPVPVAEETQLAPEKVERINQAWDDTVASLPAEQDGKRERPPRIGPRIRRL
jgi:hypothetical protein